MKTIQTSTHLLLIDETAETYVKNDWILDNLDDNIIHEVEVKSGILMKGEFKIIAASPKLGDLPEFETLPPNVEFYCLACGISQETPFGKCAPHHIHCECKLRTLPSNTEDDVERLAENNAKKVGHYAGYQDYISGYKQAKSETMFSLEQLKIAMRNASMFTYTKKGIEKYIESLTKPKQYEFVPEMIQYVGIGGRFPQFDKPNIISNKIQGIWKQITHTG